MHSIYEYVINPDVFTVIHYPNNPMAVETFTKVNGLDTEKVLIATLI